MSDPEPRVAWGILRLVAAGACAAAILFAAIVVLVSLLQPSLDPYHDTVSLLVRGRDGVLVAAMMVVAGVAIMAMAAALHITMQRTFWAQIATWALGLGGLQVLVMGFFPTDPTVIPDTVIGSIHAVLSGVGLVMLPISFVILSWRFHRDPRWRAVRWPAHAVAWLSVATSLVYGVLSFIDAHTTLLRPVWDGLAERVLIGTIIAWLLTASLRLWHLSHRSMRLKARPIALPVA
ncbi:MAG: DUF998 domain-containing protein [bacterium]